MTAKLGPGPTVQLIEPVWRWVPDGAFAGSVVVEIAADGRVTEPGPVGVLTESVLLQAAMNENTAREKSRSYRMD